MWFGTQDGLNKYDGYRFRSYHHDPTDPNTLSSNDIRAIYEDRSGRLWVGTWGGGLNCFDRRTERFTRYKHQPGVAGSISHNEILAIFEGRSGSLWVGTGGGGLNRLDLTTMQFERFDTTTDGTGLSDRTVHTILEDRTGTLWIGTDKGLDLFDPLDGVFRRFPLPTGPAPVKQLFEDRFGTLWIGTWGSGLIRYQKRDGSFSVFQPDPTSETSIGDRYIASILEDGMGKLWVGTRQNGLCLFDHTSETFSHFRADRSRASSLSHNEVLSIYEDGNGILWFGTYGGLSKFNRGREQFRYFQPKFHDKKNHSQERVFAIYEDGDGLFWIGTNGGISLFDRNRQTFTYHHYDADDPTGLSAPVVRAIRRDRDGNLWVGTYGGLNRMLSVTPDGRATFKHYFHEPDNPDSLAHNEIRAVFEDRGGNLWIATRGGGLDLYDPTRDGFIHHRASGKSNTTGSIGHDRVYAIIEDLDGMLWIGTYDGLSVYDRSTMVIRTFRPEPGDDDSLSYKVVMSLHEDQQRALWIGTFGGGLNRFDRERKRFRHYGEKDGLPNEVVYGILEDAQANLWVSTNQGLSRFDPVREHFRNYDVNDGLQDNEFNAGAWCQARNREMFFGGINGFTTFFPARIKDDRSVPNVVITDLLLFNVPVKPGPKAPMNEAIENARLIRLQPDQDVFSLSFAALHFGNPERNRYAYRLEGWDRTWISTSAANRIATYSRLPAGSYIFRVKASNKDGVWNNEGTALKVIITPPLWLTWWARLFYFLLFLVMAITFYRAYEKRMEKQRILKEERELARRLRELDKVKDEFLANTSHELRTPLNGIIGLAESLVDGATGKLPPETVSNLSLIVTSGRRLANLVNDILDFSRLKNQTLELRSRALELKSLGDIVLTLLASLARGKELELINAIDADLPPVQADEDRLLQILHNLVGNAIKFTEKGWVRLSAERQGNQMVIYVADTGIGMGNDKLDHIFESFEQADGSTGRTYGGTGLGLAVTRKLVTLHGGTIQVSSSPGEGSTFSFTLPLAEGPGLPATPDESSRYSALLPEPETPIPVLIDKAEQGTEASILVVDDEPINRQLLINHLSLRHYQITEASTGKQALALLEAGNRYDLILLDIMMPRISGFEVCRQIRERFSIHELPIIFLTARDGHGDLVTGFSAGGNDYLVKPIGKEELLARVRIHLRVLEANRSMEKDIVARMHELEARNKELVTLDGIVKSINRETAFLKVLQTVLDQGRVLFSRAEKAVFYLWEPKDGLFHVAVSNGYDQELLEKVALTQDELIERYTDGARIITEGVYLIRGFQNQVASEKLKDFASPQSLLAMMVEPDGELQGLLVFFSYTNPAAFDESDGERLARYQEHAVSAVLKARLVQELRDKNEKLGRTRGGLLLREKMASTGILTNGIARELQNPLKMINNLSSLSAELLEELEECLQKNEEEPDDLLEELTQNNGLVAEQGHRAGELLTRLLELSSGDATEPQATHLNPLIDNLIALTLREKGLEPDRIQLVREMDENLVAIECVYQDVSRALIHILNNALESLIARFYGQTESDQGRPVLRIRTRALEDKIEIAIADNGEGIIEPTQQKRIFEPFVTTRPSGGVHMGLGLYLSRKIIEDQHQGRLLLNEEEKGLTEFLIILPVNTT